MEFPRVKVPLSREDARNLKLGDVVVLDGEVVVTIGLPTHQRMVEYIRAGKPLPFNLSGGAFFQLAICSRETDAGAECLYVNPTTSTRFNPYMPEIIRACGLSATSGKGGLDRECARAMQEVGCVYFSMVGGSSALLSLGIKEVIATAWDDFITQFRLTKLRLEGFGPLTVAIDAHGNSLYENLSNSARERLPGILERLHAARVTRS